MLEVVDFVAYIMEDTMVVVFVHTRVFSFSGFQGLDPYECSIAGFSAVFSAVRRGSQVTIYMVLGEFGCYFLILVRAGLS